MSEKNMPAKRDKTIRVVKPTKDTLARAKKVAANSGSSTDGMTSELKNRKNGGQQPAR